MASDPKRAAGDRRDGRDGTVDPTFGASLRYWEPGAAERAGADANASIPCGWGRLIFAHTFHDPDTLIDVLTHEAPDERDIALYVTDPHVVLARAPQDVFLKKLTYGIARLFLIVNSHQSLCRSSLAVSCIVFPGSRMTAYRLFPPNGTGCQTSTA